MSEPFLSEIRLFGFNFPPRGWAQCDGQILSISQNQSLYSLLGTTYGGNGITTFGLPELRGRSPLHNGGEQGPGLSTRPLGSSGGQATVTLTTAEMPAHSHPQAASASAGTTDNPTNAVSAVPASSIPQYADSGTAALDPTGNSGGGLAHENMPPWLAVNFCIALQGLFPSRN